jgi:hypothetical protein
MLGASGIPNTNRHHKNYGWFQVRQGGWFPLGSRWWVPLIPRHPPTHPSELIFFFELTTKTLHYYILSKFTIGHVVPNWIPMHFLGSQKKEKKNTNFPIYPHTNIWMIRGWTRWVGLSLVQGFRWGAVN